MLLQGGIIIYTFLNWKQVVDGIQSPYSHPWILNQVQDDKRRAPGWILNQSRIVVRDMVRMTIKCKQLYETLH